MTTTTAGWKEGGKQRFPLLKESISFLAAAACFPWSWIPVEVKWQLLPHHIPEKGKHWPWHPGLSPTENLCRKHKEPSGAFSVSWGSLLKKMDGTGMEIIPLSCYLFIFSPERKLTPFLCCCTLWSLKCYSKKKKNVLSLFLTPIQHHLKRK